MTESNRQIPAITDTSSRYYIDANNLYKQGIKFYLSSKNRDEETYKMAYYSFYRAYKSGLMKSAFWVAMCYQYGNGVEKNYEAANDYFKTFIKYERDAKTHSDDYAEALYIVSQNLRLGRGTTQDIAKANKYLERAAKCEHTQAQYEWGARLLFGYDALQNIHDGIEYLKAATKAHNGSVTSFVHPDAAALLGWCYD
ncbi:MAG: sel1 repeat family protein, partial [Clostridia bacterium]|nr:sel1 repeat family protein [Clostridia bacterium]